MIADAFLERRGADWPRALARCAADPARRAPTTGSVPLGTASAGRGFGLSGHLAARPAQLCVLGIPPRGAGGLLCIDDGGGPPAFPVAPGRGGVAVVPAPRQHFPDPLRGGEFMATDIGSVSPERNLPSAAHLPVGLPAGITPAGSFAGWSNDVDR